MGWFCSHGRTSSAAPKPQSGHSACQNRSALSPVPNMAPVDRNVCACASPHFHRLASLSQYDMPFPSRAPPGCDAHIIIDHDA